MRTIEILDCTLRDGGYVNDNHFGSDEIKQLIQYLEQAGIDIIECGYLKDDKESYSPDVTEYKTMEELTDQELIASENLDTFQYTLMLLGEKYKIENLPESKSDKNNIIRMSFHKHSLAKAIEYAKEITKKGYRLFLQPTVIMTYKEEEIITMLDTFNRELSVEAVAIVDTFGQMTTADITRITKLFDTYLKPSTKLAFHSHNNLQMAFSNAIQFIDTTKEDRNIVIDSSICGMGRGAGNLPTELIANYLNVYSGHHYHLDSILEAADNVIEKIKEKHPWGYSLPYYLSAIYACHPSYILYLLNKKMLDSTSIHEVVQMIRSDKKTEFDKEYIGELYQTYSSHQYDDRDAYTRLQRLIGNREVVLIGPGQSIIEHHEEIEQYTKDHDCFVITLNHPDLYEQDAVFYSNRKRYQESVCRLSPSDIQIVTSNISVEEQENKLIFDYAKSLSRKAGVTDSALPMCLHILEQASISKVTLAGFDGFTNDLDRNFYSNKVSYLLDKNYVEELNETMRTNIEKYREKMLIKSLTPSKNID